MTGIFKPPPEDKQILAKLHDWQIQDLLPFSYASIVLHRSDLNPPTLSPFHVNRVFKTR
jgi:hypothetical protein